jgi:hypothetical protein
MSTEPELEVVSVERIDGNEIIIEFSDSTCATYTPQELADLRPLRKKATWLSPGQFDRC